MPAVKTTDTRLNGIGYLAVADADHRLVASCAGPCTLVTINITEEDELPISGVSAAMDAAPEALAADGSHVFVLVGKTIRSYTNAATPVFERTAARNADTNRWIDLVGSAYVIFADGDDLVTAARTNLADAHRSISGIGRIWSGVYDASSGYAYLFAEHSADCAIFLVNSSTGALTLKNIIELPSSAPIEAAAIAGTNLYFVTRDNARFQAWDISQPEEPVYVSQARIPAEALPGFIPVTDRKIFLSTDRQLRGSNDEFDSFMPGRPLFHSSRIFVPQPNPGTLWSSTKQFVYDVDADSFVELSNV